MKKEKKKVSIQSRRRLFFLRPICLFFISFLAITFATNSYDLYQLNKQEKKKNEEYEKLQEKTEYLKNEITKLNNPEYIAKYARENYSYSKDDEVIVKVNEQPKEQEMVTTDVKKNKVGKKIYIIGAVGILIINMFFHIIKKKGNE